MVVCKGDEVIDKDLWSLRYLREGSRGMGDQTRTSVLEHLQTEHLAFPVR